MNKHNKGVVLPIMEKLLFVRKREIVNGTMVRLVSDTLSHLTGEQHRVRLVQSSLEWQLAHRTSIQAATWTEQQREDSAWVMRTIDAIAQQGQW